MEEPLRNIIVNERSKLTKGCIVYESLQEMSGTGRYVDTDGRLVVAWGRRKWSDANGFLSG